MYDLTCANAPRFVLIECIERDISVPEFFRTYEDAFEEMKTRYSQVVGDGCDDDGAIDRWTAYACSMNHDNIDWRIYPLEDLPGFRPEDKQVKALSTKELQQCRRTSRPVWIVDDEELSSGWALPGPWPTITQECSSRPLLYDDYGHTWRAYWEPVPENILNRA